MKPRIVVLLHERLQRGPHLRRNYIAAFLIVLSCVSSRHRFGHRTLDTARHVFTYPTVISYHPRFEIFKHRFLVVWYLENVGGMGRKEAEEGAVSRRGNK